MTIIDHDEGETNTMNQVATKIETGSAIAAMTPMDMLNRAVESNASMEVLEKLLSLQERWESSQARKAFDEAIAAAKAEIKPVVRNASGHNAKRYADFAAIAKAVDPVITKFGLSYRFRTTQTDRISVTCVLSHKSGHSEETTLSGPADASGSKNAIQAIGSTLSYLQRYSLVQMLGLAATDDDDGATAGIAGFVTDAQLKQLTDLAAEVGADVGKACRHLKIETLADLPASRFNSAMAALEAKRSPL